MPKSKKENIEEMTLDPIEEKVKEPAPVEEPVEEPIEPETVEEGKDITEPDAPIEPEFEEPVEEGEQGEDVEFDEETDEETGDEETDEDAPEKDAPPFLGLMLGAKNAPVSEDPDPQSRIEALLWHIINGTTTDAEPQSRNEAILTAIANSGTYTEEAQSRIEALLISILNHEESDITPISRNEAILKAIANSGEYGEEPQSRNEELLLKWLEAISIVIGTASGAVASFNTSLTENLLSAVAEFSASQASGTPTPAAPIPIVGVDKVNVVLSGKNLFRGYGEKAYIQPNVNYYLSSDNISDGKRIRFLFYDKNNNQITPVRTSETTQLYVNASGYLVLSSDATYLHFIVGVTNSDVCYMVAIDDSATAFHYPNYPNVQLEIGSTATDYEPYQGTTALINLGGTYYGGSVDAVTGKITLTHKKYVFDENLPQSSFGLTIVTGYTQLSYSPYIDEGKANTIFLSDKFGFETGNVHSVYKCWNTTSVPRMFLALPDTVTTKADAISWFQNNPTEVIAELATPIVVYASNTAEIPTLNGFNQVFADTGDVEVKYKKRRND